VLPAEEMERFVALGELALDGQITAVAGVLNAAVATNGEGLGLICPAKNGGEAAWSGGEILAPSSLLALINHFKGSQVLSPPKAELAEDTARSPDLADIKGQETAKRALEVAAAGSHNLLMSSTWRPTGPRRVPIVAAEKREGGGHFLPGRGGTGGNREAAGSVMAPRVCAPNIGRSAVLARPLRSPPQSFSGKHRGPLGLASVAACG